jgi:hypothetical protein
MRSGKSSAHKHSALQNIPVPRRANGASHFFMPSQFRSRSVISSSHSLPCTARRGLRHEA